MEFSRGSVMLLACLAGSLVLAGCSRDTNPVRDMIVASGSGAKVPPAPDFVTSTRRDNVDYVPVGLKPPPPKYQAKTSEQIKAVEGQLDPVRARAESEGRRVQREGQSGTPSTGQ